MPEFTNDWVLIMTIADSFKAEIIKQRLENENIAVVIKNKKDSSYGTFGEIEVFVNRNDVIKSKFILDQSIE